MLLGKPLGVSPLECLRRRSVILLAFAGAVLLMIWLSQRAVDSTTGIHTPTHRIDLSSRKVPIICGARKESRKVSLPVQLDANVYSAHRRPVALANKTSAYLYASNCGSGDECSGGRGTCFIGRCFCSAGTSGTHCERGFAAACDNITELAQRLQCFFTPEFGAFRVDEHTWHCALETETQIWASSSARGDRSLEHTQGFHKYDALPQGADLGDLLELGCGPWTQTKTSVMAARPDLNIRSVTLSDPNLEDYIKNVRTCSYRTGRITRSVRTRLINAGAEAPLFREEFDTAVMVNVLEHVLDAGQALHQLWASLKPGGILIFNDRWVEVPPYGVDVPHRGQDNVLHPVRVRRPFIEHLLAQFHTLMRDDNGTLEMRKRAAGEVGTYFIGRKKPPPEVASGSSP